MLKLFFLSLFYLHCVSTNTFAITSAEVRGDNAWTKRIELIDSSRAELIATVEEAITAYDYALLQSTDNLPLRFKLIYALYYRGFFLTENKTQKSKIFERCVSLSEEAIHQVHNTKHSPGDLNKLTAEELGKKLREIPHAAESYFWAAISWGLWGMSHSYVDSAFQNVVGKIDWYAKVLISIDENHVHGAGYRLLGRLYTATPQIPFITDWIDRKEGIRILRKAVAASRSEVRNLVFLAEAILNYEKENLNEAILLLQEACSRTPNREFLLEERFEIEQGCTLLVRAKKEL